MTKISVNCVVIITTADSDSVAEVFIPQDSSLDNNHPRLPICGMVSNHDDQEDKPHSTINHATLSRSVRSSVSLSGESSSPKFPVSKRNVFSNHADNHNDSHNSKRPKINFLPKSVTINGRNLRSHGLITSGCSNGIACGSVASDTDDSATIANTAPTEIRNRKCLQQNVSHGNSLMECNKLLTQSDTVSLSNEGKGSSNSILRNANILPHNRVKIDRLVRRPGKQAVKSHSVISTKSPDESVGYFTSIFSPDTTVTRSKAKSNDIQVVKVTPALSRNKTGSASLKCSTLGCGVVDGLYKGCSDTPMTNSYPTLLSPNGTTTLNISVECKRRKSLSELDLSDVNGEAGGTASARLHKGEDLLTSNNVIVAMDMNADDETVLSLCGQSSVLQKGDDTMETCLPRHHHVASITIETNNSLSEDGAAPECGLEVE